MKMKGAGLGNSSTPKEEMYPKFWMPCTLGLEKFSTSLKTERTMTLIASNNMLFTFTLSKQQN